MVVRKQISVGEVEMTYHFRGYLFILTKLRCFRFLHV